MLAKNEVLFTAVAIDSVIAQTFFRAAYAAEADASDWQPPHNRHPFPRVAPGGTYKASYAKRKGHA